MMYLPLIVLFQVGVPCSGVEAIRAGETAKCTGLLWSEGATRDALLCRKTELPKCENDCRLKLRKLAIAGRLNLKTCEAERKEYRTRATSAESLLLATEPPTPAWVLPVLTGAAFVAGIFVGGYAISVL